jgi:hypothetical protein
MLIGKDTGRTGALTLLCVQGSVTFFAIVPGVFWPSSPNGTVEDKANIQSKIPRGSTKLHGPEPPAKKVASYQMSSSENLQHLPSASPKCASASCCQLCGESIDRTNVLSLGQFCSAGCAAAELKSSFSKTEYERKGRAKTVPSRSNSNPSKSKEGKESMQTPTVHIQIIDEQQLDPADPSSANWSAEWVHQVSIFNYEDLLF